MSDPRVVIVGPGAMGLFHAARLVEGGLDVTLLDHDPRRARRLSNIGITVEREGGMAGETPAPPAVPVACTADPRRVPEPDLIIVLVKAYHTTEAALAAAAIPGDAPVLTLQNGLDNWEAIAEHLPLSRVLAGTASSGATLLGEGHIREAGVGVIRLGAPGGNVPAALRAAALLQVGGLAVEVDADIEAALWHKAMINAAINPLTALAGVRNGQLLDDPDLLRQAVALAEEVVAVADAAGIDLRGRLAGRSPGDAVAEVCRLTAQNQSSMLQDVLHGRRTEIDSINGEIARRALECGTRAPLSEQMVQQVHELTDASPSGRGR